MPVAETTTPHRFMPIGVMARSCALVVGMGLVLPLMACSGRIGEDACISCSAEKTDTPPHDSAAPSGNAVGEGMGGPTGSPQQAGQDQSPGAASAPGM
ncbi:hypothetical protein B0W47_01565 [Komagataeibacter nataicola]|uniref:Uncharacterized protein n=1 Tax=Komagataeibacter nataicola TaxID=265960 RepID=A0A9N7H0Q4_9PROT|nr:hypothetical protein [Komagataeibacter nataicola]AQU86355.1 hypothetical protein B0W47_01565 [Komagataeibacter nataicola]PYD66595.1 hypothetical protein CDI09_07720 [Komagataeibacter nataicola]WEQ56763.1 hypothetical protein LV564_06725 [Komagataeibacter nataicola]WNM08234.1 hypothetical protein RI056_15275 [Komagataeibacter nataicola]GBR18826.1 hypothetical protein AA0616_1390 [Komagataeibacter nataicola NRIC 0616]